MVTQLDIEEKVVDYIVQHGHKPRFVLLDKESYSMFNKIAHAKERIKLNKDPGDLDQKPTKIRTMYTTEAIVDILSVDLDKPFFEVV